MNRHEIALQHLFKEYNRLISLLVSDYFLRIKGDDEVKKSIETQDFMTVLLVKSSLTEEDLRDYYKASAFKTLLSSEQIRKLVKIYGELVSKIENEDGTYAVEVFVNQVTESKLTTIKTESFTISLNKTFVFSKLDEITDYSNYYFIILSDAQYPEYLDISLIYSTLHNLFSPKY